MATELAAVLAVAAAAVLLQVYQSRTDRRARAGLFDLVRELVPGAEVDRRAARYPTLSGRLGGHPVRLRVVVDGLAPRSLPSLYLVLTLRRPTGVSTPLDALADPTGTELVSANHRFGYRLPTPSGLPSGVRVAAAGPDPVAPDVLERLVRPLRRPGVTGVHVGPAGVRLTYRLARSAAGPYRTARQADFGPVRLTPSVLGPLLAEVADLADLADPASPAELADPAEADTGRAVRR